MMAQVKIAHVNKVLPPYCRPTEEILPFMEEWLKDQDERFKRKALKIVEGAQVNQRYGIMPIEEVFTETSFEAKNQQYVGAAKEMGSQVLQDALSQKGWSPESLDYIITVSCTGIMIPSLDAYIINELGLRQDIVRLPVTEMGCAAGISGLIYAAQFLHQNPEKRLAMIAIESPTATFQLNDFSMANVVSAAIFGDGAACVLLSSEQQAKGPHLCGGGMYHFPNATHMMGFDLTNTGLKMILDPTVPDVIADHFPKIIDPFLAQHGVAIEDIDHLIFHPGGKKIVQTVEALFGRLGKNIDTTKKILQEYGNMSSVTVLYVLESILQQQVKQGDLGLMLSFGPGFSAQRILLQW